MTTDAVCHGASHQYARPHDIGMSVDASISVSES